MTQSSTQIIIGNDRKQEKGKRQTRRLSGQFRGPARILAGIIKSCVECMLVTCRDYDPLESETTKYFPIFLSFFFFLRQAGSWEEEAQRAGCSCEPVS